MSNLPSTHQVHGTKHEFVDILRDVRAASDLKWSFFEPKKFANESRTSAQIIEQVLASDRVNKAIQACEKESELTRSSLEKEALTVVTEMAHDFSLNTVRMVAYPTTKIFQTLFTAIYTNAGQIHEIKELSKKYPIVLMPNHKTYMDFLLITYLCFHFQLNLPAIAAGMDFLSMHTVGDVLRKCGAFFIRRSFGQDKLYWAIFTEYVQTHLRHNDRPVEFFLEGTRSRTGKSLYPKFGLLQALIEPYFRSQVYDIMLVPVSISYGRLLEETLYPYELLGFPKPAESTSGLMKARSILSDNFGDIFVNFCSPISVREHMNGSVDRGIHALQPDSYFFLGESEKTEVKKLAHHIIKVQQDNLVVTVWPLLCALLSQMQISHAVLLYEDICSKLEEFVRLVEALGTKVLLHHASVREDLRYYVNVHDNIVRVEWNQTPRLIYVNEVANKVANNTKYSGVMTNEMIDAAVPKLVLSTYANMCIHAVNVHSYVCAIVRAYPGIHRLDLNTHFNFLLSIFKREFVIGAETGSILVDNAVRDLAHAGVIFAHDTGIVEENSNIDMDLLVGMVKPYIVGYWVVCDVIRALNQSNLVVEDNKWLVRLVQSRVIDIRDDCLPFKHNVLNTDFIKNTLNTLHDMNIVIKTPNPKQFRIDISSLIGVQVELDGLLDVVPPRKSVHSKL